MPPYKQSQSQNPTRRRLPLDHLKFKPSPYASNLKVRTPHKDSFYCAKTSPFKSSQIYLCAKIPYFKPTWSTQIQLPGIGNTDSSSLINFEIMCMVTSIDLGSKKNTKFIFLFGSLFYVFFWSLFRYCHNVQFLSLAYCKKFSDRGLQYLSAGKCSKKLEYLDLSGCLQVRFRLSV